MTRCRSRCRCERCCAPRFVPFYPLKCGGLLAFTFEVTAQPGTYSAAGTLIQLSYTIINSGTKYLCGDLRIAEAFLGTQYICGMSVAPGSRVTYHNNYQVTTADMSSESLTFSPVALVGVCKDVYLNVPASVTVPRLVV